MSKQFQPPNSPSRWGWALLIILLATAVALRFVQLGDQPPGLYRDEATNGLDALAVLAGEHALFFTENNGREPAYIYLTAAAVALFGRSVLAVRLAAAVVGALTVIPVYLLAQSWFDRRVGWLAAWLWAVTLWSVHLSRIGLRAVLLVPVLSLAFWVGTLAYRRGQAWLWLVAGLLYGATFYTYLAARFTPALLLALLLYLLWQGRGARLWPGVAWFALGTAVTLGPLALLFSQDPALILGRAGQVSILNPAVHGGNLWGALAQQTGRALGMFLWRGDMILRHNPAGRPVFDLFLALPFLVGLLWTGRYWRRPAAAATLLWVGIMLGPTILAEDTPHFLRAVGVLPAALLLPALGLAWLWQEAPLPRRLRPVAVALLLGASLLLTLRDYVDYNRQPDVAYLFETAVRDLATEINETAPQTAVFVDEARLWQNYPSLRFLVPAERIRPFNQETGLSPLPETAVIFAWPYDDGLDAARAAITPPALLRATPGSLARGDLEPAPYSLYTRYDVMPRPDWPALATFGEAVTLHGVAVETLPDGRSQVELYWQAATAVDQPFSVFVHLVGPEGLVAQSDGPPAGGLWPVAWWPPELLVADRHLIDATPAAGYSWHIGLYDPVTLHRWPARDAAGQPLGDLLIWPAIP